jgi:hypothetical protein
MNWTCTAHDEILCACDIKFYRPSCSQLVIDSFHKGPSSTSSSSIWHPNRRLFRLCTELQKQSCIIHKGGEGQRTPSCLWSTCLRLCPVQWSPSDVVVNSSADQKTFAYTYLQSLSLISLRNRLTWPTFLVLDQQLDWPMYYRDTLSVGAPAVHSCISWILFLIRLFIRFPFFVCVDVESGLSYCADDTLNPKSLDSFFFWPVVKIPRPSRPSCADRL